MGPINRARRLAEEAETDAVLDARLNGEFRLPATGIRTGEHYPILVPD